MKMADNMTTANSLNSIAVNAIFPQVSKTDPTKESPGVHNQILFERVYNFFDNK